MLTSCCDSDFECSNISFNKHKLRGVDLKKACSSQARATKFGKGVDLLKVTVSDFGD